MLLKWHRDKWMLGCRNYMIPWICLKLYRDEHEGYELVFIEVHYTIL